MAYKRVTAGERAQISRWLQEGETRREIARRLGRSAGSISREIFRNMGLRGYRPKQADEKARFRAGGRGLVGLRMRCGPRPRFGSRRDGRRQ